jgi:hypothetical protein
MDTNPPLARNFSRGSPEPPRRMAELVARLLSHYWTADDHPAMRQAQAEDWLDDLVEFDLDHVAAACREWRRGNNRRPTPSDIRALAIAEQSKHHGDRELDALPAPSCAPRKPMPCCWEPAYAKVYREGWFLDLSIETQRRYKEQDLARSDAHRSVETASPMRQADAEAGFVKLCREQAAANLAGRGTGR